MTKKTEDYLDHANECEQLASTNSSSAQRDMLLTMARRWRQLAKQRRRQQATQRLVESLRIRRPQSKAGGGD